MGEVSQQWLREHQDVPLPAHWQVTFVPRTMLESEATQLADQLGSHFWFTHRDVGEPETMTVQVGYDRGFFPVWPKYSLSSA